MLPTFKQLDLLLNWSCCPTFKQLDSFLDWWCCLSIKQLDSLLDWPCCPTFKQLDSLLDWPCCPTFEQLDLLLDWWCCLSIKQLDLFLDWSCCPTFEQLDSLLGWSCCLSIKQLDLLLDWSCCPTFEQLAKQLYPLGLRLAIFFNSLADHPHRQEWACKNWQVAWRRPLVNCKPSCSAGKGGLLSHFLFSLFWIADGWKGELVCACVFVCSHLNLNERFFVLLKAGKGRLIWPAPGMSWCVCACVCVCVCAATSILMIVCFSVLTKSGRPYDTAKGVR